jgi:predicted ATP-grasp superfamily ATP-dependent carboligase
MKILVVGISARAMVESAVRSGYPVVALDAFGDRDLRERAESYSLRRDFQIACSPENFYTASRGLTFDAVAFTANFENHPEILARLSATRAIVGNAPQAVAAVRNWPVLFEKLGREGFPAPRTYFAAGFPPPDSGSAWLRKPLLSGGGHGIRFCDIRRENPFDGSGREDAGVMVQEYIPGRPCSAAFVADGKNSVLLGITEQLIGKSAFGARGFRYCGNLLSIPEMQDASAGRILREVRRLTAFLTREFGLTGVNGIDFILKDGQVYLIEVNPRYSASMEIIETAYGLPIFRIHLRAVLNSELPVFDCGPELKRGKCCGKSYLYAERDVRMPDTGGWTRRGIRDVPGCGEAIRRDGPVCTVFAEGPTREDTFTALMRRAEKLKEEIYG